MQILKPAEVRSIEQFFQLKQDSLLKVMYKFLKSKYETVHYTKDYIVAVGDIPVALVAHMDTVFTSQPDNIFYDRVKNVMWSPDGLGADDRAGVYSIVQILKQGFKPTVIFTTDEEKGAIGASKLVADFKEAPTELKYIIELDRRGSVDCVFYDCDNPKFEEYVESFGFITAWGSFTDISIICPAWGVAGVNLSIGYEDEHSYQELLYIGRMLSTIKKVVKMLQDVGMEMEPFEYISMEYNRYFSKMYPEYAYAYGYGWDADEDYGWDPAWGVSKNQWKAWHIGSELKECCTCGVKDFDYNQFPVKGLQGTIFMCADCISKDENIAWCKECGEPFEMVADEKNITLCYDCRKKSEGQTNGLLSK